ncbi:hypothetical protein PPERSA_01346 [Pseudocohnilembus persalinus]|uniref:protein-tyrosine-phosphatase n=1 Tax=Pseudocohnilembus persalinus TaxID=266149 RepID=A0A0V0QGN1_PSEPJ|nr:hypothetical protein PPERSA_01346 [Pseudocohnilembus persalinus]|eukprot:KRX01443.1 hypothetical protein PPERSA_01346 [Pseudocohnilembus persalinus]
MTQLQLSFPQEVNFSPTLPNILDQDDMNCILEPYKYQNDKGGLYLGNIQSALNLQELEFHKIRTVFTTSQDLGFKYPKEIVQNYKCLNAIDRKFYDLSVHFEESIDFIQKHIKNTNILVHCQAGCSRSASIVIVYLMHAKNWNLEQALIFVKRKRPIVHPNPQFMKYLYEYDQKLKAERKNKESELRLKNQQKIQQIYQIQRAEGFSSRTPSQSKNNIKNLFQQKQEKNINNGNLQYQSLTYIPKNKINLNECKINNNNLLNNNESVNQIPNTAVCQINQEDDEPEITNRQNLRQQSQGIKIHQNDLNIITKSNQQFTLKSNVKQNYNDYDKENDQQSSIQFNNDKIQLTPYDNYKYNQNDLNKMNLQGSKSVGSDRLQQIKSGSNNQKSIPENSKTFKNLTSQFQIEYDTDNHYINQQQLLSVQKKTQSCLQQQPYGLNEQTENQNVKNSQNSEVIVIYGQVII